ncbi:malate dehydrogenase [Providencia alcalifaciens]|uniref:malate dehydrogenase n=1 Tax=Providencia alcalifaciens TaxID=126385 RepID=UPI0018C453AF|nr:malate dehydrogenase [Providencia alcalifaciens]MBG5883118.1 malate dehydrogenase [Providencia alcalifaciens]
MENIIKIVITGSAGKIGSSIAFRIAAGELYGSEQKIDLHLLETSKGMEALKGIVIELEDSAFPLLNKIVATDVNDIAFTDADIALLIGSTPRTKGMERGDLLEENAAIFREQGKSINKCAKKSVKVVVVGNPANTNAFITYNNAKGINPKQFTALMRLDHNRAVSQLALKTNSRIEDINGVIVWGNHSSTQYPDLRFATIKDQLAYSVLDNNWVKHTYIKKVANRGAEILETRPYSAVHGAVSATLDHMRDWIFGSNGRWRTMAVISNGEYGVPAGLIFGMHVVCHNGDYQIVDNIIIDSFSKNKIEESIQELQSENFRVSNYL